MIKVNRSKLCIGCLICEMACSFHHSRSFSKSRSSITVNKDISIAKKGAQIKICYEEGNCSPACDLCKGEDFKFCVNLCPQHVYKAERRKK
jgi:Fe-S-cluster-containing hydrogenase component 2